MAALATLFDGGYLGNRLVQSVPAMAFARDRGAALHNLSLCPYADLFRGSAESLTARFPGRRSRLPPSPRRRRWCYSTVRGAAAGLARTGPRRGLPAVVRIDWDQHRSLESCAGLLARHPLVILQGWMFTYGGIAAHRDEIRDYFALAPGLARRVAEKVTEVRSGCDTLVGMHVRRGDYADFLGGKYFFDWQAYRTLITQVREEFGGDTRIVVTSDDAEAADRLRGRNVSVLTGTAVEDMYALAACDFLIGPPSTFTLWASFVGEAPLYQLRRPVDRLRADEFDVSWAAGREGGVDVPGRNRDELFERALRR